MSQTTAQSIALSPPRPNKARTPGTAHKSTPLTPLRSQSTGKKAPFAGDLDPSKYRKLEGVDEYTKALQEGIKLLQLPFNSYPPPDVLRKDFQDALLTRNVKFQELADAEQRYEDSESALHQILGAKEVQAISQALDPVKINEPYSVRRQYIAALARVQMRDFCLSRKE